MELCDSQQSMHMQLWPHLGSIVDGQDDLCAAGLLERLDLRGGPRVATWVAFDAAGLKGWTPSPHASNIYAASRQCWLLPRPCCCCVPHLPYDHGLVCKVHEGLGHAQGERAQPGPEATH